MDDILLLVNIGNTATTIAAARGRRIAYMRRLRTDPGPDAAAVRATIMEVVRGRRVGGAVICSVVPARTGRWRRAIVAGCRVMPLIVSHRLNLGLRLKYPRPETLGADRLANICAAAARWAPPLIIIDAGTATTFDVINRKGEFVGGAIAPGPAALTDYMADRTALLPRIKWPARCGRIGRSTRAAMAVGAGAGYRGMLQSICDHLASAAGGRDVRIILTGGFAARLKRVPGFRTMVRPALTLEGLERLYSLNRCKAR